MAQSAGGLFVAVPDGFLVPFRRLFVSLRNAVAAEGRKRGWNTYLPEFKFTTDNAAMIAITGYFKYQRGEFAPMDIAPVSRIGDFSKTE